MKKNIGKNTLGDNDKMSVTLGGYGRSTHDLSYAWRSPMGVGTLVPFMKFLALPDDTFEINMDTKIMTHPTVGPLFGTFKFQADVFTCPIRLYNAMLHNNALNIGLEMSKVKLPKAKIDFSYEDTASGGSGKFRVAKGSIAEYLGVRGESIGSNGGDPFQIVPFLAYYDIFKNYYANKQEEYFQVMGGSKRAIAGQIITPSVTEAYVYSVPGLTNVVEIHNKAEIKITKGLEVETVKFLLNGVVREMYVRNFENKNYFTNMGESKGIITYQIGGKNAIGEYIPYEFKNSMGNPGDKITLTGKTQTISEGQAVPTYTSSYQLTQIDDLREYILSLGKKQLIISETSDETLKSLFIFDVFRGTPGVEKDNYIYPLVRTDLGGLCLKTHQSDIYSNWVNAEWIDGDNGITAITGVAVQDGKFTIDALNLAQKVYNMLNRIAISGGTYKDWIETVYDTDYYFRAETPVYEGGLSTMIDFEPVVSNSSSTASGSEEPLGTLAGRGISQGKKGGNLKIKITEPCYIIGIASITPLVDYSQGNDWDMMQLDTLDDLHKPGLDAIGYQDLMSNTMHYRASLKSAIGKQPAWINYMTNVNRSYGAFAAGDTESYMVLNRIYDVDEKGEIENATTYINPKDYTYIFATNTETNTDFWVQIGCGVKARRVMSAKQIPLM